MIRRFPLLWHALWLVLVSCKPGPAGGGPISDFPVAGGDDNGPSEGNSDHGGGDDDHGDGDGDQADPGDGDNSNDGNNGNGEPPGWSDAGALPENDAGLGDAGLEDAGVSDGGAADAGDESDAGLDDR